MSDTADKRAADLPPSLTRQLIAYIGNKRRLLPFLAPILASGAPGCAGGITFLDPMCGSGAVARLARHLGFTVFASDWEDFACAVTTPVLENSSGDLERVFGPFGGVAEVLRELNEFGRPGPAGRLKRGYIAAHFAPEFTDQPRLGRERLFYTAENACFIDRVRDRIEERYPAGKSPDLDRARRTLIALLLYEASNHANTSGVFKAYHRGFGGHGRDALSRILAPMELEYPTTIDGPVGQASRADAKSVVSGRTADICYLDPPYNSHQYGSNYFMLNTIARWDKPDVSDERDSEGNLLHKAGIRSDWIETRSPFCSRKTAPAALSDLVDSVDARVIVVSYSESGVISPEAVADLLAPHGDLSLQGMDYTAYRGGRQSLTRASVGRELVFVVTRSPGGRTGRTTVSSEKDLKGEGARGEITRQLSQWKVRGLLRGRFVPERLRAEFSVGTGTVVLTPDVVVSTSDFYRLGDDADVSRLSPDDLCSVSTRLERAHCADFEEEFRVLLSFVCQTAIPGNGRRYHRRLLTCLRKFAHRKYREQFFGAVAELRREVNRRPEELARVGIGLERIVDQAALRFGP